MKAGWLGCKGKLYRQNRQLKAEGLKIAEQNEVRLIAIFNLTFYKSQKILTLVKLLVGTSHVTTNLYKNVLDILRHSSTH